MSAGKPLYLLSLLGVAAWWLWQVQQLARRGQWPQLGVLMPLGLAALLGAPQWALDVPALFGMGLAFALIAAYFPLPVTRPSSPPLWILAAAALLLGIGAPWLLPSPYAPLLQSAALLYGLALLSFLWRVRRRPHAHIPAPITARERQRWQPTLSPDPPDLEVTLEVTRAVVLNASPYTLEVLGWSPASLNAWLPLRGLSGERLRSLGSGQRAILPGWAPLSNVGLRLWYLRQGEAQAYLFRADWDSRPPQSATPSASTSSTQFTEASCPPPPPPTARG